jgi:tetratricopeptide (TPR) repeat protein
MEDDFQSQCDKAVALQHSGQHEEAIREFNRLAKETTDVNMNAALLLNAARCYLDTGHIDDADRVMEEINQFESVDDSIRINIDYFCALILAKRGESKQASIKYKDILEEYAQLLDTAEYRNKYVDICFQRAIELVAADEHHVAIPLIKKVISFSNLTLEDQQELHFGLGCCYEKLREYDLAIDEYRRVIEFHLDNTNEADARYYLARLYFYRGGFAHAKQQLEAILRDYEEKPLSFALKYVYELLSEVCKSLGEKKNSKLYAHLAKKAENK